MAFLSGADGGTRTRDLFLTKEVLYLLSYISVLMILTVCDDLRLPAFLPPDGFTKEVLYLLSYISVSMILTACDDLRLPAFLPPDGFTGVRVPLGVPAERIFGGVKVRPRLFRSYTRTHATPARRVRRARRWDRVHVPDMGVLLPSFPSGFPPPIVKSSFL